MAKSLDPREHISLQELAVSNAHEIAVLERKGLLTKQEVLREIERMRKARGAIQ